jgi:uncharacterized membrane protein YgdD (TMEM256/DUF423 family)
MARTVIALAGVYGAMAVALGAFGAHGLRSKLEGVEDAAKRLGWWETAAHYHLVHAVALGIVAIVLARETTSWSIAATVGFAAGVALFSGTLYAMALGAPRWLGAVTPLGGLGLIVGWVALAVAGWRAFD